MSATFGQFLSALVKNIARTDEEVNTNHKRVFISGESHTEFLFDFHKKFQVATTYTKENYEFRNFGYDLYLSFADNKHTHVTHINC